MTATQLLFIFLPSDARPPDNFSFSCASRHYE